MIGLNIVAALYVIAQTEALKQVSTGIWGVILLVVFVIALRRSASFIRQPHRPSALALGAVVFIHAAAFFGLFLATGEDANGPLLNLLKVLLIFMLLVTLRTADDMRRVLLGMADAASVAILFVTSSAYLGVIPTTVFAVGDRVRDALGFWNPNVALSLTFLSALTYAICGTKRRLDAAMLLAVAIGLGGALSRTFFVSILLLWLGIRSEAFGWTRALANASSFITGIIALLVGVGAYAVAIFAPDLLQPLVMSPVDLLLSFRMSLLADYFVEYGRGPFGFVVLFQDSIYFELVVVFGLPLLVAFVIAFFKCFANRRNPVDRNIFMALTVVLLAGLTESMLLKVASGSLITLIAILIPSRLNHALRAANTVKVNNSETTVARLGSPNMGALTKRDAALALPIG